MSAAPPALEPKARPAGWRRFLPPPWRNPAPVVAVLRFSGVIGVASPLRPGITMAGMADAMDSAFGLRNLNAVGVVINSPGGSAVQSTLILRRLRALAGEKKVPIFVFCEDVAASGGYLLALAGEEIYADASSIVGSIGVISASYGFDRAIERLGIDRRVYTAGEDKLILDPFQPEKPDDVAKIKALMGEIHETFKNLVRERRGAKIAGRESELFTGAFWTGSRALDLGLIDGIGDIRAVMRGKFGRRVKLKPVAAGRSWPWQRGQGVVGQGAVGPGAAQDGLARDLIASLEERALWARYGL